MRLCGVEKLGLQWRLNVHGCMVTHIAELEPHRYKVSDSGTKQGHDVSLGAGVWRQSLLDATPLAKDQQRGVVARGVAFDDGKHLIRLRADDARHTALDDAGLSGAFGYNQER